MITKINWIKLLSNYWKWILNNSIIKINFIPTNLYKIHQFQLFNSIWSRFLFYIQFIINNILKFYLNICIYTNTSINIDIYLFFSWFLLLIRFFSSFFCIFIHIILSIFISINIYFFYYFLDSFSWFIIHIFLFVSTSTFI